IDRIGVRTRKSKSDKLQYRQLPQKMFFQQVLCEASGGQFAPICRIVGKSLVDLLQQLTGFSGRGSSVQARLHRLANDLLVDEVAGRFLLRREAEVGLGAVQKLGDAQFVDDVAL